MFDTAVLEAVRDHVGPWTSDDLDVLGEHARRAEIVGGEVLMAPEPAPAHARAAFLLARLLDDACPDDLAAYSPVGVNLGRGRPAYTLRDGAYVELAAVRGDETYAATVPFPVRVTPNALLT